MNVDQMLFEIRQSEGKPFRLVYVRSTGANIGSVGQGEFVFGDYIDTNADDIKLYKVGGTLRTLKITHIFSFNSNPIQHR